MERSEELVALLHGIYEEMRAGDVAAFEGAAADNVLVIGSDPDEWWSGRDATAAAFRAQTEAMGGGFPVQAGDAVAYVHGDAGWIVDRPTMTAPDGSSVRFRFTVVAVRDDGEWKLAHMHISLGVPNEEVVGQELPV